MSSRVPSRSLFLPSGKTERPPKTRPAKSTNLFEMTSVKSTITSVQRRKTQTGASTEKATSASTGEYDDYPDTSESEGEMDAVGITMAADDHSGLVGTIAVAVLLLLLFTSAALIFGMPLLDKKSDNNLPVYTNGLTPSQTAIGSCRVCSDLEMEIAFNATGSNATFADIDYYEKLYTYCPCSLLKTSTITQKQADAAALNTYMALGLVHSNYKKNKMCNLAGSSVGFCYERQTPTDQLEHGYRLMDFTIRHTKNKWIATDNPYTMQRTHCHSLRRCLREVRTWSDKNPGHSPIVILIRLEETNGIYTSCQWDVSKRVRELEQDVLAEVPAWRIPSLTNTTAPIGRLRGGILPVIMATGPNTDQCVKKVKENGYLHTSSPSWSTSSNTKVIDTTDVPIAEVNSDVVTALKNTVLFSRTLPAGAQETYDLGRVQEANLTLLSLTRDDYTSVQELCGTGIYSVYAYCSYLLTGK